MASQLTRFSIGSYNLSEGKSIELYCDYIIITKDIATPYKHHVMYFYIASRDLFPE